MITLQARKNLRWWKKHPWSGNKVQNLRRLFVQQPCSRFKCRLIVCEFKYGSKLFTLHWIPIDYRLLSRYSVNNLLVHVLSEASLFSIEKKSRWVSIIDEHSNRRILNTLSIILSLTATITHSLIVLNKTNQILLEAYRVIIPHYPRAASILTLPQECILEFKFDIKQKLIRLILTHIWMHCIAFRQLFTTMTIRIN